MTPSTYRVIALTGLVAAGLVGCGGGGGSRGGAATYSASITPTPDPLMPGVQARLDILVKSPSGAPVTSYADLHTQTMHVIVVSQDLEELQHVHPMLGAGGHLMVDTTLTLAEPYKVFMEYQPSGAEEQLTTTMLTPSGAKPASPRWDVANAFSGSTAFQQMVDQTYVMLTVAPNSSATIMAGVTSHLMIEVRADDMMSPANVEDWLGMPGHAIVLSGDLNTFFHLHALRGGSGMTMNMPGMNHGSMPGMNMPGMSMPASTSGSTDGMPDPKYAGPNMDDLSYDVKFPVPGLYKVFFQFQRAGRVITAPFLVRAS